VARQGKGNKDRYVPIGVRAAAWLQKYIREARPQIAIEPDDLTVFLTGEGEPFSRDHLTVPGFPMLRSVGPLRGIQILISSHQTSNEE
jgi:site-specific recombinase XerD